MRHKVKNNHLSRKSAHRKALLSHLSSDLIKNKRIVTTLAKAKALRIYVEPLITKSKTNTTHNRRIVFRTLQDKEAVAELFGDVSAKIGNRPGGYTRIIKLGTRLGDSSEMALIELVDYNDLYSNTKESKPKRKRTRRSGSRKKTTSAAESTEEKKESEVTNEASEAKSEVKDEKEGTQQEEKKAESEKDQQEEAEASAATEQTGEKGDTEEKKEEEKEGSAEDKTEASAEEKEKDAPKEEDEDQSSEK